MGGLKNDHPKYEKKVVVICQSDDIIGICVNNQPHSQLNHVVTKPVWRHLTMKNLFRLSLIALFVLITGAVSWQGAFAGAADPDATTDVRYCGLPGTDVQTQTVRWTDIFSVPDPDAITGNNYAPSTPVTIEGRDYWGCWVKVSGGGFSGWLPVNAITTRAVMGHPILFDNSAGKCVKDGVICGADVPDAGTDARFCGMAGTDTAAQTTRWTDVFSVPDPDAVTGNHYAPNSGVTITGRDYWGCWVMVEGAHNGWLPVNALNTRAVMGHPVKFDNSAGKCLKDGVICGPAGSGSPDASTDARFCGMPGTDTAAQTTRWTDVFSVPDPDANTGSYYAPNSAVTISGRDYWGCWVMVDGGGHSGWLPVNAINTRAVMGHPIKFDNSAGKCLQDGVICTP
jgi:hypothetical protein